MKNLTSKLLHGLLWAALLAGCSTKPIDNSPQAVKQRQLDATPLPREAMPYFWPYEGVPEPKWPQAHPDAVYKEGMTGKQYWEHLCKLEAGSFIYRTVQDVESVYFVRLRPTQVSERAIRDLYALEDPYGMAHDTFLKSGAIEGFIPPKYTRIGTSNGQTTSGDKVYRFIEAPQIYFHNGIGLPHRNLLYPDYGWSKWDAPDLQKEKSLGFLKPGISPFDSNAARNGSGTKYVRMERNPDEVVQLNKVGYYSHNSWVNMTYTDSIQSRYGVLWRGIERPRDREFGIAGGEVIVLDLKTNEILAVRRGFVFARANPQDGTAYWLSLRSCPANNLDSSSARLIRSTLQPKPLPSVVAPTQVTR